MKHEKQKDFSKLIVCLVIIMNILFTSAVLYVFWHTGSEPTSLIACFFGFTTGELWMLSKIKRTKMERVKEDESDSDY